MPAAQLAQLGPGVRGLLAQDFLSAFSYTLNYRRHRLTWDEPLACDAAAAVPMAQAQGRFTVALQGSGGSLRLVPDSGSEPLVFFKANGAALPGPASWHRVWSLVRPELGPIPVAPLGVGDATLRDSTAYVTDRVDEHADGLLPLHGFSSVSFGAGGACLMARR